MNTNTQEAELRAFLEDYARASFATNPEDLARMYAPRFIVGGPRGSMCFAKRGRL
jgi:hypothetical protein